MNTGIMGKGMGYPIYIPSLETLEIPMCKFKNGKWRWLLSYYYIYMNNGGGARKNFEKFLNFYIEQLKRVKIYKWVDICLKPFKMGGNIVCHNEFRRLKSFIKRRRIKINPGIIPGK
ncbi:hypothetical protein [Ferroplasma acidiphilum]|uniref:hypothetical protein n=1 Tax=Ferroplasma acidiphilum TaxID=74969 RepID=UPI0023F26C0A|nr:hypothetical protein [Ferroplasma acidiphilum]